MLFLLLRTLLSEGTLESTVVQKPIDQSKASIHYLHEAHMVRLFLQLRDQQVLVVQLSQLVRVTAEIRSNEKI